MALAYVLIQVAPTKEHEIYNKLLRLPELLELHHLCGEYDLIAKIEAEDFNKVSQFVVDKIRSVKGVTDTKTLPCTKN